MKDEQENTMPTAASRYEQLLPHRSHFVDRADEAAKLTLPALFMRDGNPSSTKKIIDPVQSLGTSGVNTLASKMTLSVLPMSTPFFKLNVDELKLKAAGNGEKATEIKKGLGVIERGVIRKVEDTGDVTTVTEVVKHLIVVGNCLMYIDDNGSRMYDLNKYVVLRDPQGRVLEIVVCEEMSPDTLPEEAKAIYTAGQEGKGGSVEKTVKVYTHVKFAEGRVKWYQEIMGQRLENTGHGDVPEKGNPWLALRFIRVDGEDYGRGYVEMYMGDLMSLEVLTKAVRDAAIAASKVVWLVKPNGSTNAKVIAKADNNDIKSGDANDVTCLRLDKAADLRVAEGMIRSIESRLSYAFMSNSDALRDAERVTAEEVRFVAQELDDSLGGIYSTLSLEFQLPYVKRRMHLMLKAEEIPPLPDIVSPVIVTGFAALGRGHDRDKLMRFAQTVVKIVGPERLGEYVDLHELISRLAIADGIETEGLLVPKPDPNATAPAIPAEAMELVKSLGPEVIKQIGAQGQGALPAPQPQTQGTPNG